MSIRRLPVHPNLDQLKHQAKKTFSLPFQAGDTLLLPRSSASIPITSLRQARSLPTRNSFSLAATRLRAGHGSSMWSS